MSLATRNFRDVEEMGIEIADTAGRSPSTSPTDAMIDGREALIPYPAVRVPCPVP